MRKVISLLIFCMTLLVMMYLFTEAVKVNIGNEDTISVRGVAERTLTSDRVDWRISLSTQTTNLDEGRDNIEKALAEVKSYLEKEGVSLENIKDKPYSIYKETKTFYLDELGNTEERFQGYNMSKGLEIKAFDNPKLVEDIKSKIGLDLSFTDVGVTPSEPYYYFSKKVVELKQELLQEASKNALERAKLITNSAGASVGKLKSVRQGGFMGFGEDGFGKGGYVGSYGKIDHVLNAQVSATYEVK